MSSKITNSPQIFLLKPTEDPVFSLLFSFLDLHFDVVQTATGNKTADRKDIKPVSLD